MNNDDITHNMIIRTIDSNKLPDVENYVRSLYKKGYFAKLIKEGMFTVEEIKKLPIGKMCDIFFRKSDQSLQSGDIRIFKDSGDYAVNLESGV
ncbi:MAG: hypothetical protein OEL56_06945 [Nitrosopumilus sp.]|nr:hypothetical protein [Nitrosopumilus sp.]MDH3490169.1 hypothetical protein [Nitrosopumilus sp.]MDH3516908.1 hypothetical protein [Nitrosopumilus sp.]MDH3565283.1 hypothetical protein [Nitrosopumilus sp.]MDH5416661.1 hypothetical protein [Nitrosopumilus sp.]